MIYSYPPGHVGQIFLVVVHVGVGDSDAMAMYSQSPGHVGHFRFEEEHGEGGVAVAVVVATMY